LADFKAKFGSPRAGPATASCEGAPDSKLRDTHQLHLCRAPALIVPRMLRSAISAFTRVFDAPLARLRASSTRYGGVVRCNPGASVPLDPSWVPALRSSVKHAAPRPGHERNLLSPQSSDLPVGRFVDRGVESPLQKYFGFHTPQITSRTFRIPSHTEGRFAIVTDVGHGMRWTRQRLARDGIAGRVERPVSDQQHADERRCYVRRSRVVLTPRRWRQGCGYWVGPTGRGHNISPQTTVAKEPGHRGEHEVSRKAIACGDAGRFRCTRCYSCAFHHHQAHTRLRVQRAPGIPHALYWGRKINAQLGRITPRGRERAFCSWLFEIYSVAKYKRATPPAVIARHRVGASRRPMTGSSGRSSIPERW